MGVKVTFQRMKWAHKQPEALLGRLAAQVTNQCPPTPMPDAAQRRACLLAGGRPGLESLLRPGARYLTFLSLSFLSQRSARHAVEEMLRGPVLLLAHRERVDFITYQLSSGGTKTTSQAMVTGEMACFSSAPERFSISH